MRNSRLTKLVALATVLLVSVATLAGSTVAWFTDTETSLNTIQSGSLDIQWEHYTGELTQDGAFEENKWAAIKENESVFAKDVNYEPGYTEVVYLRVKNAGDLHLKYNLDMHAWNSKVGTNKEDGEIYLTDHLKAGAVLLSENNMFTTRSSAREAIEGAYPDMDNAADGSTTFAYFISDGSPIDAPTDAAGVPYEIVTGADEAAIGYSLRCIEGQPLAPGEGAGSEIIAVVIYMPEGVGNEANHKVVANENGYDTETYKPEITFGLNLEAAQHTVEEDSFDETYDEYAEFANDFGDSDDGMPDGAEFLMYEYVGETSEGAGDDYYRIIGYPADGSDWLTLPETYDEPENEETGTDNPEAPVTRIAEDAFKDYFDSLVIHFEDADVALTIDDGAFPNGNNIDFHVANAEMTLAVDGDATKLFAPYTYTEEETEEEVSIPLFSFYTDLTTEAWEQSALKESLDNLNLEEGTHYSVYADDEVGEEGGEVEENPALALYEYEWVPVESGYQFDANQDGEIETYYGYYKTTSYDFTTGGYGWETMTTPYGEQRMIKPVEFALMYDNGVEGQGSAPIREIGAGTFEDAEKEMYIRLRSSFIDIIAANAFGTEQPMNLHIDQNEEITFGDNAFANKVTVNGEEKPQITFHILGEGGWKDSVVEKSLTEKNLTGGTDYLVAVNSVLGTGGMNWDYLSDHTYTGAEGIFVENPGFAINCAYYSGFLSLDGTDYNEIDESGEVVTGSIVKLGGAQRKVADENGIVSEVYPSFNPDYMQIVLPANNVVIAEKTFAAGETLVVYPDTTLYGLAEMAFTESLTNGDAVESPIVTFLVIGEDMDAEKLKTTGFYKSWEAFVGEDTVRSGAVEFYSISYTDGIVNFEEVDDQSIIKKNDLILNYPESE